jgi:hypothetical protein
MRDDSVTVIGPLDGPGTARYFVLEHGSCPCQRTHTVTFHVEGGLVLAYREALEYAMDMAFHEMRQGLDWCGREHAR